MKTTLNEIRKNSPCESGWQKLLAHLGKTSADDEPLNLTTVFESNGFLDALWCIRCFPEYKNLWIKYAVWCARQVQHLMKDQRSIDALNVAWDFSNGEVSVEKLRNAEYASYSAIDDFAEADITNAAYAANYAASVGVALDSDFAEDANDTLNCALLASSNSFASEEQAKKFRQIIEAGEWVD